MATGLRGGAGVRGAWARVRDVGRPVRWKPLALAVTFHLAGGLASAQSYEVRDLGTLGGTSSRAAALDSQGRVVGSSQIAGDAAEHAFLYDGSRMRDLGTLSGLHSFATGINQHGQISGYSGIAGTPWYHAFLYDNLGMHDLGAPVDSSYGNAINNSGQIVGHGLLLSGGNTHALRFDGGFHDLGVLPGFIDSIAYGINDSGHIVGQSRSLLTVRAFLFNEQGIHDLGTLGGGESIARAVNGYMHVVGSATTTCI
jgi:probable HAF family extracellular repeat protein